MGQPTWMYRRGAFGRLESKIFDSDDLPASGWCDSPAKIPDAAPKPKAAPAKAKRKVGPKRESAPSDAS